MATVSSTMGGGLEHRGSLREGEQAERIDRTVWILGKQIFMAQGAATTRLADVVRPTIN